jgi:RNA recognition motif-containing protein
MGTKLYVGNLNYSTTEDSLRQAFSANGREVTSVAIIMDRETGRSRGFAFVEMATPEAAQQALQELDGTDLDGRTLRINEARERDSRGPRPGGFGGPPRGPRPGGFGGGFDRGPAPGGGFDRGPAPGGFDRAAGGPPGVAPAAPDRARNFGEDKRPARGGGGGRKERERGRDDDDRGGRRGGRRGRTDGDDGW